MKEKLPNLTIAFFFLFALPAAAITHYVDLNSPAPTPPYGSWANAATNIQDAIDAAAAGDLVLVTNGVYQTGGVTAGTLLTTNRVAVTKPLTVQSVNGPLQTIIQGYQMPGTTNGNSAIRGVYLTNGAALVGFTVSGGATHLVGNPDTEASGGGIWCAATNAAVSNCIIRGNAAGYSGGGVAHGTFTDCVLSNNFAIAGRGWGGGAYNSVLSNCVIAFNFAYDSGGGGVGCSLSRCRVVSNFAGAGAGLRDGDANNCLLIGNSSSQQGGGALDTVLTSCTVVSNSSAITGGGYFSPNSTVRNCIFYYNTAPANPNLGAKYDYCCTIPNTLNDGNSFTNPPLFLDPANGDFRLQSNSPCINAGANNYVLSLLDLGGSPRIAGVTVDVGAAEFQSPTSIISYAWLQKYGLPTDGSVDFVDGDGDGANTWSEWRADTVPTNALSVLRVTVTKGGSGPLLSWPGSLARLYFVRRSTDLITFSTIATNLSGVNGTKTFTDSTAGAGGPYFYRVGVP